jgi:hypothetical protein
MCFQPSWVQSCIAIHIRNNFKGGWGEPFFLGWGSKIKEKSAFLAVPRAAKSCTGNMRLEGKEKDPHQNPVSPHTKFLTLGASPYFGGGALEHVFTSQKKGNLPFEPADHLLILKIQKMNPFPAPNRGVHCSIFCFQLSLNFFLACVFSSLKSIFNFFITDRSHQHSTVPINWGRRP